MKPLSSTRRTSLLSAFSLALGIVGCMGPVLRNQSPDLDAVEDIEQSDAPLISKVTQPFGMNYVKVEAVSMVTGLAGTGEDPAPSPQRASLMAEMQRREIENPNQVLGSPNTALVLVRGFQPPGMQEGDRFDLEVRTPSRSNTTSLRGGKLLETRLSETAILNAQLRTGHLLAVGQGAVLVDPSADPELDPALARKGRVLGGGIATKSRNLGLVINSENQSVRLSQAIGKAINKRFYSFRDGQQRGMSNPKTDEFVDLEVHPRYKDNVGRYMRVVRNIAINESEVRQIERMRLLQAQLLDPVTAAMAAIRLEAIGNDEAVRILKEGIESDDPEVRFYASEALAYLDETEAVDALAQAAEEEPAFRVHALVALSAMDDGAAFEALRTLLSLKSAETRYGAFRAMTAMSPADTMLIGEDMNGLFRQHRIDTEGDPLIHVTSSHHPELVFFGRDHFFELPLVLDAGPRVLVNGLSGEEIKVSRFGETTQQRVVSTRVEEVVRAIVELGGDYPDVVQMLQQAKQTGALNSRFAIDALPAPGRERLEREEEEDGSEYQLETPEPDLFVAKKR